VLFRAKDLPVSLQKVRIAVAVLVVLGAVLPELSTAFFTSVSDKKVTTCLVLLFRANGPPNAVNLREI
jgi:hypothetical protein